MRGLEKERNSPGKEAVEIISISVARILQRPVFFSFFFFFLIFFFYRFYYATVEREIRIGTSGLG